MRLLRSGKPIGSIFDLLGTKEDDMTYSLGYVASRSAVFASKLVHAVGAPRGDHHDGLVRLQEVDKAGRTDVEIEFPGRFHGVFEAKRGPWLPDAGQLSRYVPRLQECKAKVQRLVTVTNAPREYAVAVLPKTVDGIPVVHLQWREIWQMARKARADETNRNKNLLDEFDRYLKEILGMENMRSNMVYVLSLGAGEAWGVNFKDVAVRQRCYFDPVSRYRAGLPNYIAFRYDGHLQAIHHVDATEVFENPQKIFSEATETKVEPHYLFRLGPPIRPDHKVKNGPKIRQANRVWCMLDLLLTSDTITDALLETKNRIGGRAADLEEDEA